MVNDQDFKNKLIGGIGRTKVDVDIKNPFPFVGDTVDIKAITRWAQQISFQKKASVEGNVITDTVSNTKQEASSSIIVTGEGDIPQVVSASNFAQDGATVLFNAERRRYLYSMVPQEKPYFEISLSSEINRTTEFFDIIISPDNGYDLSRDRKVDLYILKEWAKVEDGESGVLLHLTESDFVVNGKNLMASDVNIDKRGIYDLYVEYTDVKNGEKVAKRVDKLLSVTPRLAVMPEEGQQPFSSVNSSTKGVKIDLYKTGVNDLYMIFSIPNLAFYKDIDIKDIPEGYDCYTMVLRVAEELPDGSQISRVRFDNTTVVPDGITNPTPQFSYDNPLVITHDSQTFIELHGESYNTISFNKLWHSVLDGRGYHNVSRGIKLTQNPGTGARATIHLQYSMGSSYMELFEIEMSGCSFAGLSAKTDPNGTNPQYWHGNFEQRNFWIHHNYIHDTEGEGVYIGYFTPETSSKTYTGPDVSFKDLNGDQVSYVNGQTYKVKAHYLPDLKFYRNNLENTGFDGVQFSSTFGDICYNKLVNCSWKEEINQSSGASIQSFSGNFYNNLLLNNHGPSIQLGPIGDVKIFNNVIYSPYGNGVQFLFAYATPEQNPSGAAAGSGVINNDIMFSFYNNVLITPGLTANGRNTVQMTGLHMYDNILGNNGTLFSNMTDETLSKWNSQAVNNVIFNFNKIIEESEKYKIADYINGDFRIAYNSPLVNMGMGRSFVSDMRGYVNWYSSGIFPVGPFMGKYKDNSLVVIPLVLKSMDINQGDSQTESNVISITYVYDGKAAYVRAGLDAEFTGSKWESVSEDNTIKYTIPEGQYGKKTVYLQLKNISEESNVLNKDIEYVEPVEIPLVLNKVTIGSGGSVIYEREAEVYVDYTDGTVSKAYSYRASEDATSLDKEEWISIVNPFRFVFSDGYGDKSIYVQLSDDKGNTTDVVSSSVKYEEMKGEITAISFLWSGKGEYDDANNISKVGSSLTPYTCRSNMGKDFCKISRYDSVSGYMVFSEAYAGATTGDNSFEYPDEYMLRTAVFGSNKPVSRGYKFEDIAPGSYCVRVFSTNINSRVDTNRSIFKIVTGFDTDNEKEYVFDNPKDIVGNISEWMVQEVVIGDDGAARFVHGIVGEGSYTYTSMSIIEFRDVVPATSMKLSMLDHVDNTINLGCVILPVDTTQTAVDWSIKNPTQNASIDRYGVLTINPSATHPEVIEVVATNKFNPSLSESMSITIKYN